MLSDYIRTCLYTKVLTDSTDKTGSIIFFCCYRTHKTGERNKNMLKYKYIKSKKWSVVCSRHQILIFLGLPNTVRNNLYSQKLAKNTRFEDL